MAQLEHGQWDLAGYRFGVGYPVYPALVHPGGVDKRVQDQPNPAGDGLLFGRDYRTPRPWVLDMTITGATPAEAAANAEAFERAWEYARETWKPGEDIPLTFNRHGAVKRIYGRPRALDLDTADLWTLETVTGQKAEFQPGDATLYADAAQSITLTMAAGRYSGFVFPVVFPWSTTEAGQRQGVITSTGRRPTHDVRIRIHGPIKNPVVKGPGWTLKLTGSLAYDRYIDINARAKTATWDNGGSAVSLLSRSTFFSDIVIKPGNSELTFTGEDETGTSTATITWNPTI
ncbi:hypothetical protein NQ036_06780 [Brevibacterium sp. 91QC2O2]|uniref:hypothetical protein n=1 Tax=Brevibacterium sp. 91QC2O2 TaxID=2968458 RepID=UPI00211CCE3F|nr:hypothetical protein [Brevibacterium sp. 91QC2O2]MCQ9367948.1 hypothetical protein [Brevibacterium sp. 91QC2O2]